ncbi:hypothetical protein SDC9_185801 [bioreactor metagenome]|uniref:Uncharacterized protein n=1 Tax=bioreactor metagenome TaxID=1076179 RepID=A0A645HH41_9ZZZZ
MATTLIKEEKIELVQIGFEDIATKNLFEEIKAVDVLNMTPMEGFNKLYELINKAKKI